MIGHVKKFNHKRIHWAWRFVPGRYPVGYFNYNSLIYLKEMLKVSCGGICQRLFMSQIRKRKDSLLPHNWPWIQSKSFRQTISSLYLVRTWVSSAAVNVSLVANLASCSFNFFLIPFFLYMIHFLGKHILFWYQNIKIGHILNGNNWRKLGR